MIFLQDAMFVILEELQEGDRFNIITFNGGAKPYKDEMIDVTMTSLFKAKEFVSNIIAEGCKFSFKVLLIEIE